MHRFKLLVASLALLLSLFLAGCTNPEPPKLTVSLGSTTPDCKGLKVTITRTAGVTGAYTWHLVVNGTEIKHGTISDSNPQDDPDVDLQLDSTGKPIPLHIEVYRVKKDLKQGEDVEYADRGDIINPQLPKPCH